MVTDFKGRRYKLIGVDECFTYLECFKTQAFVKISNAWFEASGFRSA